MKRWSPEVKLIFVTPEAEKIIEEAFRNCWQSEPKPTARGEFLKRCIQKGHLSPLEFASAIFVVTGSRAYTHQQVRHRIASYAQESQRYVKPDSDYVVIPPAIYANKEAREIFEQTIKKIFLAYEKLLELGIRKEDARYLLPNACKSKIFISMNFRAFRHFFKLRCEKSAQWEIRQVAKEMLKKLYSCAPAVFEDLYEKFILASRKDLWTERD